MSLSRVEKNLTSSSLFDTVGKGADGASYAAFTTGVVCDTASLFSLGKKSARSLERLSGLAGTVEDSMDLLNLPSDVAALASEVESFFFPEKGVARADFASLVQGSCVVTTDCISGLNLLDQSKVIRLGDARMHLRLGATSLFMLSDLIETGKEISNLSAAGQKLAQLSKATTPIAKLEAEGVKQRMKASAHRLIYAIVSIVFNLIQFIAMTLFGFTSSVINFSMLFLQFIRVATRGCGRFYSIRCEHYDRAVSAHQLWRKVV